MSPPTEQKRAGRERPCNEEQPMDLSNWINTPNVSIDFRENYGKKLLHAADGKRPQFRLMPKYLCNGYGEDCVVQFYLTFEQGRMLPNWEDTLFTPRGCEPVPALSQKLPPWSPDQEPLYSKVLAPLGTALAAADTKIERLEASLPMYMDHSPESRRRCTIDRVRMVYLENAVDDKNPNLVLVVFAYQDGYKVHQNGCGTGPPQP
jgi:hypothetical protein